MGQRRRGNVMTTERVIRWSTAGVVLALVAVAAVVSYNHAYWLVSHHGESGIVARLEPLTVDGLIYASSMVMLDSARRQLTVPRVAWALLSLGIAATLTANVAHGLARGAVGAVVAAWPAVAVVGSYELLMWLIRTSTRQTVAHPVQAEPSEPELRQRAAEAYRASLANGRRYSERGLAAEFGKTRRWAQKIIRKVRAEANGEVSTSA